MNTPRFFRRVKLIVDVGRRRAQAQNILPFEEFYLLGYKAL
jgi:hypothetical protein